MGRGFVASGNLCQVGWEDTTDDLVEFVIFAKEIQHPCGAQARLPAAVSKGAAVLFAKPG